MTHAEIELLLASVPLCRMTPEERLAVDRELAVCPACRRELRVDEFLEETLAPLREARRQTALRLASTQRTLNQASRRHSQILRRRSWVLTQSAAAALLLGAATLVIVRQLQGTSEIAAPHPNQPVARTQPPPQGQPLTAEQPAAPPPESPAGVAAAEASQAQSLPPPRTEPGQPGIHSLPSEQPPVPPPGLARGKTRLRVIAEGSPWSGHDSIRLSDGQQGLDYFEADLRAVTTSTVDGLVVSLGGGSDPARLTDLGTPGQAPRSLLESDVAPIETGKTFLLRTSRAGAVRRYRLQVAGHLQGQYVDLEWVLVDEAQAQQLVAEALRPRPAGNQEATPGKPRHPAPDWLSRPNPPSRQKEKR